MTMPSLVGHPDWQEYANWRGQLTGNPTTLIPVGVNNFGPYVVTNYASLFLQFAPTSGNGQIIVHFYDDIAATNEIVHFTWDWYTGSTLQVLIPILGSVCVVEVDNDSGADVTASYFVETTNMVVTKLTYQPNPTVDERSGVTIAGGATVNVYTLALVGGPGTIYFDANTGYNKLSMVVSAVDHNQVVQYGLWKVNIPATAVTQQLIFPQVPLQVRVVNTDPTNSYSYSWTLTRMSQA